MGSYPLLPVQEVPNCERLLTIPRLPWSGLKDRSVGWLRDGWGTTSPSGLSIPCYRSASYPCTPSTSPFVYRPPWKALLDALLGSMNPLVTDFLKPPAWRPCWPRVLSSSAAGSLRNLGRGLPFSRPHAFLHSFFRQIFIEDLHCPRH